MDPKGVHVCLWVHAPQDKNSKRGGTFLVVPSFHRCFCCGLMGLSAGHLELHQIRSEVLEPSQPDSHPPPGWARGHTLSGQAVLSTAGRVPVDILIFCWRKHMLDEPTVHLAVFFLTGPPRGEGPNLGRGLGMVSVRSIEFSQGVMPILGGFPGGEVPWGGLEQKLGQFQKACYFGFCCFRSESVSVECQNCLTKDLTPFPTPNTGSLTVCSSRTLWTRSFFATTVMNHS